MKISRNSIEILLDLVEIKLSLIEVYDDHDRQVLKRLLDCKNELVGLSQTTLRRKATAAQNKCAA